MMTSRILNFVLQAVLAFFVGSEARAQGVALDSISRQVGNQIQAAQTGSIYGQLVNLDLVVPDTQRRLASARYQEHDKILIEHFADGTVLIWNFERGAQLGEFRLPPSATPVRYDAMTGDLYLLRDATLYRARRTKGDLAYEAVLPDHPVTAFVSSPNGKSMFLGTQAGEAIKLGDTGKLVWKKKILDVGIRQLAASHDGLRLTVLGEKDKAMTLNADGGTAFSHANIAALGGYDRNGTQAYADTRGEVLSVSAAGAARSEAVRPEGPLDTLSISRNGSHWLAVTREGRLGQVTGTAWNKVDDGVRYAAFLGDTRYLYIRQDGVAYLRDVGSAHYLLTVIPAAHGWVVVDHEGRYDGTVAGTKDVTWKADAESLSLDQFFESYYQPGLLTAYLNEGSGKVENVPANFAKGVFLPPKVEMDFPGGKMVAGQETKVLAIAESRGGDLSEGIRFFHNGKRLPPKARLGSQKVERNGRLLLVEVFAFVPEPGANEVFAETRNTNGITGRSAVKKEITDGFRSEGKLHIVAIGVDRYRLSQFDLDFPKADATSVTARINKTSQGFFTGVGQNILADADATKAGIMKALEGLGRVDPKDSLILVLAGHGTTVNGEWYFLPHDMNPKSIPETAISARVLQDALVNSPAKKILVMIDACNSGAGIDSFNRYRDFQRRFVQQVGRSAGVTVLTATRRDQLAAEASHLGHGLFTYIVLEGLGGLADTNPRDMKITAHELASYVGETMEERGAALLEPPTQNANPNSPRSVASSGATRSASRGEQDDAHAQSPAYFVIGSDFPIANLGR